MSCKNLLTLIVMLFSPRGLAMEHWFAAISADTETVVVENTSAQTIQFWWQEPVYDSQAPEENSDQVAARSTIVIPLDHWRQKNSSFLHFKSHESGLKLSLKVRGQSQALPLLSRQAHEYKTRASRFNNYGYNASGNYLVTNLSILSQTVRWHKGSVLLGPFEKKWVSIQTADLRLSFKADYHFMVADSNLRGLDLGDWKPTFNKDQGHVRFVLSNPQNDQSFVVDLQDAGLIAQARDQIRNPDKALPRILIAEVALHQPDIEKPKNFNQSNLSTWSWKVSRTIRFADLASQSCDGSPEYLEEYLAPWIKTSNVICFWSYKVVKELP